MGLKRSAAYQNRPPQPVCVFMRPSDAAFLLGVSRQSLWGRIDRGTVETLRFEGGVWVYLEWTGDEWQITALPPISGPIEAVHFNVNVV